MNDDMDEFLHTAVSESSERRSGSMATLSLFRDDVPKEKKESQALSQYARMGGGFSPVGQTIEVLPPDCYTLTMSGSGDLIFKPQNLVTDELLRLPDSKSEEVIEEVEHFWKLKSKFKNYGFAHKRGFLLWGPPGSGKTATTSIICRDMVKNGGLIIFGEHPGLLTLALNSMRVVEANRPVVVVLEDLDTIINNFGESAVLNLLDGESQIENVCYIATTNYPENLDGRIINRPSRFDRIVKIGMPNAEARTVYLKSRIETTIVDGIDLVKETEGLSIAHLKELIVGVYCQERPVKEVLTRLQRMKVKVTSSGEHGPLGIGS